MSQSAESRHEGRPVGPAGAPSPRAGDSLPRTASPPRTGVAAPGLWLAVGLLLLAPGAPAAGGAGPITDAPWIASPTPALTSPGPVGADGVPERLRAPRTPAEGVSTSAGSTSAGSTSTGSPVPAGLRVFLDPVSGRVVPHPRPERRYLLQQAVEESLQLRPHRGEPYTFVLPGGGTGAWVGDRFMTSTVAHVGPDGTLHLRCQHGAGEHPGKGERAEAPQPATPTPSAPVK